jgi:hypothetical protein
MDKNISLNLAIILGLIILGVGFAFGNLTRKIPACPPCLPAEACPACLLDSKLTGNWVGFAKGEVKEISGRDLTLISEGETLKVSILEGARIQFLEEKGVKEAKFEDIKEGEKLEIQSVLVEKNLFGSVVTILP